MRFKLIYRFPVPPSGNRQARLGNGHHYTPKEIEAFRLDVKVCVSLAGKPETIDSPTGLIVRIPAIRGDLDNRIKTLKDAITHAGVWTDDQLCRAELPFFDVSLPKDRCVVVICDLHTYWREVEVLARRQAEIAGARG